MTPTRQRIGQAKGGQLKLIDGLTSDGIIQRRQLIIETARKKQAVNIHSLAPQGSVRYRVRKLRRPAMIRTSQPSITPTTNPSQPQPLAIKAPRLREAIEATSKPEVSRRCRIETSTARPYPLASMALANSRDRSRESANTGMMMLRMSCRQPLCSSRSWRARAIR